jgi:CheY-like chemotaxis protein
MKEVAEELDNVLVATSAASKLTRQLLTFSRKQVVTPTELDLSQTLDGIRELLERLVGKKITLDFDFEADCPKVVMAASHLEQLVMDLAMNARDAMPNGGKLTFTLRPQTIDGDAYVELSVTDQGGGIPEEIRQHIFEPLYTTKGDAGTGLGLATCHSIVARWHGAISVESETGRGSTFRVLLPASHNGLRAQLRPSPVPQPVRRVLVVDDEPAPRATAARLLQSSGFEVIVASNLKEARDLIREPTLTLDALLTDVVLSGEVGTDLLEECRACRPNIRIVVMSGYSPNPTATEKLMAVSAKFLPKPFSRQELLRALQGQSQTSS